jgi:Uma2 family endonuclease
LDAQLGGDAGKVNYLGREFAKRRMCDIIRHMTAFEPINVPRAVKLRVQDFLLLNDAGAFANYAKSELIEGEIWVVNAVYTQHAKALARLTTLLTNAVEGAGLELEVYTNLSTSLSDDSLPEPDIVLADDHDSGAMPLAKIKLLIEVSDSTLDIDLGRKADLYARHGIAEYWVVDIEGKRIVRHSGPEDDGYRVCNEVAFGALLEAVTIAGLIVETDRLG